MNVLGSGKYGTVYKKCLNKKCINKIAIKEGNNNLSFEFRIMKLLHPVAPNGIVKPIKLNNPKSLHLEFVNMNNKNNIYSVTKVKKILTSVIETLLEIQKKYPSFRHNDLHWNNVFNSKDGKQIYIGDFGFSNIQKVGFKNPIVQKMIYTNGWGIGPKPNKKYDIALLLNDIYTRGNVDVKNYILNLGIPYQYLEDENEKVINGRMRYNVNHSKFPSLKKILNKL
jgi:hypothetical protein